MDLDLDFDFEEDKIKTFLLNKLKEIKTNNDKLKVTLDRRREFLKGILDKSDVSMDDDDGNVKVSSEVWKKIFNNKYALGVTIENSSSRSLSLHGTKALLKWDSPYSLHYQVTIFEESRDLDEINNSATVSCNEENCNSLTDLIRKSNKVDRLGHVVIVLEQPKFVDKLFYNITGNIILQQDDSEIVINFPSVEISAQDALRNHLNDSSLPMGEIRDILTLITCCDRTDLALMFPSGWGSSVDSTFEILCSLTKVDVSSRCKKFFLAHMLSPSFDGSLLECHAASEANNKVHHVAVYSRNEDCLLSLLHHLHQNIAGVVIIPKIFRDNYLTRQSDSTTTKTEGNLEEFNECVNREINFVNKFLRMSECVNDVDSDVIKFRTDLADLEKHTDLLYQRICHLTCKYLFK